MAQYKVPQDVEADDKLIGPFSFRQFVYLLVSAGLGFLAFLLFQIFPLLVIVPIPFIIFLIVLALPLKKDQPMETYLSAVVDFYLKPRKRIWETGQVERTITITAPKVNEDDNRTKDISREEAGRRLSFLANIVDTEGYAIKDGTNANLRDDIASEASTAQDMFDVGQNYTLDHSLQQSTDSRRDQLMQQMRNTIDSQNAQAAAAQSNATPVATTQPAAPNVATAQPVAPIAPDIMPITAEPEPAVPVDITASAATIMPDIEAIHATYEQQREAAKQAAEEATNSIILQNATEDELAPEETPEVPAETEASDTLEENATLEESTTEKSTTEEVNPTPSEPNTPAASPNDEEVYISLH